MYAIRSYYDCYQEFDEVLALARNPDIRFVFSNTTEAGITYVAEDHRITSYNVCYTKLLRGIHHGNR